MDLYLLEKKLYNRPDRFGSLRSFMRVTAVFTYAVHFRADASLLFVLQHYFIAGAHASGQKSDTITVVVAIATVTIGGYWCSDRLSSFLCGRCMCTRSQVHRISSHNGSTCVRIFFSSTQDIAFRLPLCLTLRRQLQCKRFISPLNKTNLCRRGFINGCEFIAGLTHADQGCERWLTTWTLPTENGLVLWNCAMEVT